MMINVTKWLDFLNENNLTAEEGLILLAVHETKQSPSISAKLQIYVGRNKKLFKYPKWIARMVKNDLLINNNPDITTIRLEHLELTDRIKNKLVIDIDEAYLETKTVYPRQMLIERGQNYKKEIFTYGSPTDDKQAYRTHVLKGSSRAEHFRFMHFVGQELKGEKYAPMSFKTFCERWDNWIELIEFGDNSKPKKVTW